MLFITLWYLNMNKYSFIILFMILVSISNAYAEHWPFDFNTLEYTYSQYTTIENDSTTTFIPTVHIVSQGPVYASANAKVVMAKSFVIESSATDTMLILETDNGFHIVYYGVSPNVTIGNTVVQGDIVGTATNPWYIRIFDMNQKQWADPFDIFPTFDTAVEMKLYDFSFTHQGKNNEKLSVSNRVLYAGNNTIDITLSVLDKRSLHYTIPQFIRITLQDTVIELWRNDLISIIDMDILNKKNLLVFSLPDIDIKKGYFIADVFVHHSKTSTRNFRFSLRAR